LKDYDDGKIRTRQVANGDIRYIAENMRMSDREEIWVSDHIRPEQALINGVEASIYCRTIENGSPIGMFGICPQELLGTKATVWLLGTEDLKKIKIKFLRNCKRYVNGMLEYYDYLENYVDVRNKKSILWLKFLGAKLDEPAPYGVEGLMFQHFSFTKGKKNV